MSNEEVKSEITMTGYRETLPSAVQRQSIGLLSREFSSMYANELVAVTEPLNELTRNQDALLETIQQESDRFILVNERLSLDQMFTKITHYQGKLANIKRDMVALHDKVAKLKKRALKLQQIREKQTMRQAK